MLRLKHLRRTDGFPDAPDILVNSFYKAETNEVAAFEELIGSHGGLGGFQTQPFVLFPVEWHVEEDDLVGAALTAHAFQSSIGLAGAGVVGVGLSLFAFSTMIAWSYYGDRSAYFLFGEGAVRPYRVLFTFLVIIGAAVPLKLVWNIADITNLLMALPNLLSLALLAGLVQRLKNEYFSRSFPIATSEAD